MVVSLRKLFGGPYATAYVFDLSEFLYPYVRDLKHLLGHPPEHYIGELIEAAVWQAGRRTHCLDISGSYTEPDLPNEVRQAVEALSRELEPVVYRMLRPLSFNTGNGLVLCPNKLVYRRGEVWLCWKTQSLY